MYLLDTCTISDFMKEEANTVKKLESFSYSLIYTSTITKLELTYGLLRRFEKSHRYFKVLEAIFSVITILSFDEAASNESAIIKATLGKIGLVMGPYDLLISGIALASNLILVTSNEREFKMIPGLKIENWRIDK